MADNTGAVDLGGLSLSPEEEAELADLAERTGTEGEPQKQTIDTAITIVMTLEGEVAIVNYDGDGFLLERPPHQDLIYGMLSTALKDLAAQETAQATISLQMMQARAMAERQQAAAVAQGLDLSKLRS